MEKSEFLMQARAALSLPLPSAILRARGLDAAALPPGVGWLSASSITPEGMALFGDSFIFWDKKERLKCYPVETAPGVDFGHRVKDGARGARHITTEKGAVFSVFFDAAPSFVVMVEGEFDALAVAACGLSVIAAKNADAVPQGVAVAVLFDDDEGGEKQTASLLSALKKRGVYAARVDLSVYHGHKDFSEAFAATTAPDARRALSSELLRAVRKAVDAAKPIVLDEDGGKDDTPAPGDPLFDAFQRSALFALAQRFGGYIDPAAPAASAQVGAALAMVAASTRGRLFGSLGAGVYPVRFTGVTLGESGAGKGCEIEILRRLCRDLSVRGISPGSDAALMQEIATAGADAQKIKGSQELQWTIKAEATPVLEIIDEAGEMRAGSKKLDYNARGDALRRMLYAERVQLPSTRATPFPAEPVPVVYTSMFFSTPEAWIDSLAGDDTKAGEARRRLEFMLSVPPVAEGPGSFARRKIASRCAAPQARPDAIASALGALAIRTTQKTAYMPRFDVEMWDLLDAACRRRLGAADDAAVSDILSNALTPLCGIAASCAALSGHDAIYNEDFCAALEVVIEVFAYRRRLMSSHVADVETQGSRVSAFVLGVIQSQAGAKGYARRDAVIRTLRARGKEFEDCLKFMIDSGVVEACRAQIGASVRSVLRVVPSEEFAAREDMRESAPESAGADSAAPADVMRRHARPAPSMSQSENRIDAEDVAGAVDAERLRAYIETVKAHAPRGRSGKSGSISYGMKDGRPVFFDHSEQVGGDVFAAVRYVEGMENASFADVLRRAREIFGV